MAYPRALRMLGYALCLIIPAQEVMGWFEHGKSDHGRSWLLAFAAFVLAYHVGASAQPEQRARRIGSLVAQQAAMVVMAVVAPCEFASLTLVVAALHASLFLETRALAALLAAQTVVVSLLVMRGCGALSSISWLLAVAGFQAAVTVAVLLERKERTAREELVATHVELRAARALLAEASRSDERNRIARELHDVLGHNLTALGLHVEAARSVSGDRVAPHLEKAGALAGTALADVRAAVGAMRGRLGPDLGRALRALCDGTPGLTVHLEVPEPLVVDPADRAHCVVRCVQEILTNTLRHARARNLWIRIERSEDSLVVDARDDGQGAREVCPGHGLSGMQERVEEMGGRLAVEAAPTFSVRARLPLQPVTS
jgi:signal transduction histidine kinase